MNDRKKITLAIIGAFYLGSLITMFIYLIGETPTSAEPFTIWDVVMMMFVFYVTHVSMKWIEEVYK